VRPGRIEVHVEELVLHGLPPLDRSRLREAFAAELASLVSTLEPRSDLSPGPALDGGTLRVRAGAGPGELGRALARQVAGALPLPGRAP
jgi:hypothetical protein